MTSSLTTSSPSWTSETSTFFLHAFFPFREGCLYCWGAAGGASILSAIFICFLFFTMRLLVGGVKDWYFFLFSFLDIKIFRVFVVRAYRRITAAFALNLLNKCWTTSKDRDSHNQAGKKSYLHQMHSLSMRRWRTLLSSVWITIFNNSTEKRYFGDRSRCPSSKVVSGEFSFPETDASILSYWLFLGLI